MSNITIDTSKRSRASKDAANARRRERYKNDPEFRQRSAEKSAAWVEANKERRKQKDRERHARADKEERRRKRRLLYEKRKSQGYSNGHKPRSFNRTQRRFRVRNIIVSDPETRMWIDEIYSKENFTCVYCLGEFPIASFWPDHIVPVSKGGESTRKNLTCSCEACNRSKKDHSVFYFIDSKTRWYDRNPLKSTLTELIKML